MDGSNNQFESASIEQASNFFGRTPYRLKILSDMSLPIKLTPEDKVLLLDGDECKLVKLADIRYFESFGNYSKTYFTGGKLLIYRTLNYLENRLSGQFFFRANRQQLINLSHIQDVQITNKSTFRIEMSCGKQIDISRRRSQKFKCSLSL